MTEARKRSVPNTGLCCGNGIERGLVRFGRDVSVSGFVCVDVHVGDILYTRVLSKNSQSHYATSGGR